jgi:hypothetical protein
MKTILHAARLTGLLAIALLAYGCATTQPLSDENRRQIKAVKINDKVQKAPSMYYLGPGTSALFAFGAVGGVAAAAASEEPGQALKEFVETNGIFVEKIALQEIDTAFRDSGKLKILGAPEAGATTMNIGVYMYGFSVPNGFSSSLLPVLAIRCELVDAAGKVIWSQNGSVQLIRNPAVPMTLYEMRDRPQRIEEAWRRAATQIARKIAYDF